jgi:hypothetical protein
MEPGGSLPHSQQPATSPYSEPAQSIPCPPSHFLKILWTNNSNNDNDRYEDDLMMIIKVIRFLDLGVLICDAV